MYSLIAQYSKVDGIAYVRQFRCILASDVLVSAFPIVLNNTVP